MKTETSITDLISAAILCVDANGEYSEGDPDTRVTNIGEVVNITIKDGCHEDHLTVSQEGEIVLECEINSPIDFNILLFDSGIWIDFLIQEAAEMPRPINNWTYDCADFD